MKTEYGEYSYLIEHTNVNLDNEDIEFMHIHFVYYDPNVNDDVIEIFELVGFMDLINVN